MNTNLTKHQLEVHHEVDYAYSIIEKICNVVGPGCPGSSQELARAMLVKDELEKVTDSVVVEEFKFAPNAFLSWFQLGSIIIIVSVLCFYLSLIDIVSLTFSIIACGFAIFLFLLMEFEFLYSRKFIDWLYKKRKSLNVVGTINPKESENIERILIFSGHHDSSLQFTWFRYLKAGCYVAVSIISSTVILLMISTIVHLILVALTIPDLWMMKFFIVLTCTLIPASIVFGLFFTERGKNGGKVPGAVDNLSGVSLAIAISKILKNHPEIHPPNTEIRIISFGAEEASVRGSSAYVKKHLAELRKYKTMCFNFESIANPEITIYKSDLNNFVKFDPSIVSKVEKSALQADVPHTVKSFPFGGAATDAMPFARANLKAISLCGLKFPTQMLEFYHQEFDTPDKINKDALYNALLIAIEFIRRFNSEDET
ncbi:MAG: Zn-dependent exopeptidase M28 [Asgard group archaeon]|nr:Zn-dependent exopeptidase M28 [Asgard group archaeon]